MSNVQLKGITWGHSRGYTPLVAAAQRYSELHPNVTIIWSKRTLQEFADFPIEALTKEYDLLIIDHPWVGTANATNCVQNLKEYLPETYLQNQAENSVGQSYESYSYNNKLWALPIDAAAPFASYRKDLLEKNNCEVPKTWNDLIALAKKGKVAAPAIPIDLLMNFYTFCIAVGETPFQSENEICTLKTAKHAMDIMLSFYTNVDKKMFTYNPIAVAELMTTTDDYWYCPFAYGYSNYARKSYAKNVLQYTNVISYENKLLKTTIGGTGLAVSAFSQNKEIAVDFTKWICSEKVQANFYTQHGGQPGHKAAWLNDEANSITNNFFTNCLPIMENGYMRPRYNGYLDFQDKAGLPLQQYLKKEISIPTAFSKMNEIYSSSLQLSKLITSL